MWPDHTDTQTRIPSAGAAKTLFTWRLASRDRSRLLAPASPRLRSLNGSGSRSVIKHVSSRITVRDDRALAAPPHIPAVDLAEAMTS